MIKAVVFDIDQTLTDDVSWLKVTELLGASPKAHLEIFNRFSQSELSYEEAKAQLFALWRATGNMDKAYWERMFAAWPLKADAPSLVDYAHARGYKTALITGSFDLFAAAIARKLGVPHWYANTPLEWDLDGQFVDFDYVRDQAGQKLSHLREFTRTARVAVTDCIAIGDGDNDIEIFKATKHGIAIGMDNPALIAVSWKRVQTLSEVMGVLRELEG